MLVALYFCPKDYQLAISNLRWCLKMEGKVPFKALIAYDSSTPQDGINQIKDLAARYFDSIELYAHKPPPHPEWPRGPNRAFQEVATYVGQVQQDSWFWWEADAVPLKKGWLTTMAEDYKKGGKPFGGHIVENMGHMNGVGIYPRKVSMFSPTAMFSDRTAWDVAMKAETTGRGRVHNMNRLIQHVWGIVDGKCCHNDGPPAVFETEEDIKRWVLPDAVIIHRVKNTSLVDLFMGNKKQDGQPDQKPLIADVVGGKKTAIHIVSVKKHFKYLQIGLRSISRFARGFDSCHVFVPNTDIAETKEMEEEWSAPFPLMFHGFDEWPGKGMMHHEWLVMKADLDIPDADFILHTDSDCVFTSPVDPSEYIVNGKPVLLYESFASLTKKHPDVGRWQKVTLDCIGFAPYETMRRHPAVHIRDTYAKSRELMKLHTQVEPDEYIRSKKNEFPHEFCEYVTLGNVAMKFYRDNYRLMDMAAEDRPSDKIRQAWSHREFTREDMDVFSRLGLLHWKKPDVWSDRAFGGDRWLLAEFARLCAVNKVKTIIETGTLYGATTRVLAHLADTVHTIEKVGTLGLNGASGRIKQWYGDSREKLKEILPNAEGPLLIFLDAHDEARNDSPIQGELEAIAASGRKDCTIVIHDFKVPDRDYGHDTYDGKPLDLEYVNGGIAAVFGKECTTRFNRVAEGIKRGVLFIEPKKC